MTEPMNANTISGLASDELTLKDLLIRMKELVKYLRAKWRFILTVSILGGVIGFTYAFFTKPIYTAALTFALEEERSGSGGITGALGLANSLGIDIGGGGVNAGGAFSGSNLMELMRSRTLVEKALLNPIVVHKQSRSLANYFIEFNHLNEGWKGNPELKNIRFDPLSDYSTFTLQQDSILGILYQKITGANGLLSVSQKDKKTSILTIEVKSEDELFSKIFAETIAKVVSDFYVDTKSKKAKLNLDILQRQTDSVRTELNAAIAGVAVANDNTYNLNPALNVRRTPSARRQVDVQANTAILTQLITNLEMAKVSLRKETPLIQVIDKPILPLKKEKISRLKGLILGFFLIGFLIVLTLIITRIFHEILEKEQG